MMEFCMNFYLLFNKKIVFSKIFLKNIAYNIIYSKALFIKKKASLEKYL